jgi:hypothetical protein
MGEGTGVHRAWCAPGCDGLSSGLHASVPVRVGPTGTELLGVTVRRAEVAAENAVAAVVVEFAEDGDTARYLVPAAQAQDLRRVIESALRQVPVAA